ncbi:hypothetical protein C8J34_11179 [Rhizobium sp. PP-F2F-G36]|nr:hypothetical protein C8J34_11179 [Rhizobium sp. PP-F2F-G36]
MEQMANSGQDRSRAAAYTAVCESDPRSASRRLLQTADVELRSNERDGAILSFELADKHLEFPAPHEGEDADTALESISSARVQRAPDRLWVRLMAFAFSVTVRRSARPSICRCTRSVPVLLHRATTSTMPALWLERIAEVTIQS